jgi:hypothetical protein
MNKGIKIYKNKLRNNSELVQPYVPQYQILGIEPQEYRGGDVPVNTPIAIPSEAANRNRQPGIREIEIPKQIPLPNVGMGQTWASLDGNILDDVFNQDTEELIDNNEFYTENAVGISPRIDRNQVISDDLLNVVEDLEIDSYLLLVKGEPICSGPIDQIEDETRALIFGEHNLCDGVPVPEEDLIVIKRIKIKVGVFLG